MKREQLLKHWSVIEAFRNGKQLQCMDKEYPELGWLDVIEPNFHLDVAYRVKPEKREMWLNLYRGSDSVIVPSREYNSKAEADLRASYNRVACVKVVYEEGEGL